MSKYTTELRYLIESKFDLGLNDYPIFDESHREILNNKIINHFYFREIGLETPSLFKIFLNRKMFEIMPYYNQRYESEKVEFNPLFNIDITETFTHEVTGNQKADGTTSDNQISDSTTNTNSTTKNKNSSEINASENATNNNLKSTDQKDVTVKCDSPQSGMSRDDILNNTFITSYDYANNNDSIKDEGTTTSTSQSNTSYSGTSENETENESSSNTKNDSTMKNNLEHSQNETYTKKQKGSSAGLPFSKAIKQWREVMLNIDMEIIQELESLFIQLW